MKSKFGKKEFMIWAAVSSWSCFCWLYRASPSLAAKNTRSDFSIDHLVMSVCRVFSCVVGRGCLLWPVCSLGKTLLAFALLHFVLQRQICLLIQVSLDFLILYSNPLWWKGLFCVLCFVLFCFVSFGVSSKRCCRSSQNQSTSASSVFLAGA